MIRATTILVLLWLASPAWSQTRQSEPAAQPPLEQRVEMSLARTAKYLLATQGKDGAWHSTKYGSMKQGAATTAFTLYAISHLPEKQQKQLRPNAKLAIDFLKIGIPESGCISNPDSSQDYPVYCTAMVLVAANKMDLTLTVDEEKTLLKFLLKSQCNKQRGFAANDPNYGGWDILGPETTGGKTTGTNVSVSCQVLEALTLYTIQNNKRVQRLGLDKATGLRQQLDFSIAIAHLWIDNTLQQSVDGGFYFTPHPGSTNNKAQSIPYRGQQRPRSYGSATSDGLRILAYCGAELDDERVRGAVGWLDSRAGLNVVPGFSAADKSGWNHGLRFYYWASLSKSLSLFSDEFKMAQRELIQEKLISLQRADGSWENSSNHMREDEPLIATGFAIIGLSSRWRPFK